MVESGHIGPGPGLGEIVQRYGRWISATLRARFPKVAEDLEQEALLRLGRNLPHLRSGTEIAVRALVSRVLRSVMVDEVRRRKSRPANVSPDVEDLPGPPVGQAPAEVQEDLARVRGLFGILSEDQRRVLRMHFQEGLALRQIADVLGVPRGTVAAWYSRALTLLRERLS